MGCKRLLVLVLVVLLAVMTLGAVPTTEVCASDEVIRYDTNGDGELSKPEARHSVARMAVGGERVG